MRIKVLFSVLFIVVLLSACKQETTLTDHSEWISTSIDSISAPLADSLSLAIIKPYKEALDSEINHILGYTEVDLFKKRPESSLSNLVADFALKEANETIKEKHPGKHIDFCLLNYGGIRRPAISKGPITYGTIYELLPFENELIVATLDGKTVNKLIQRIIDEKGEPISGMTLKIQNGKAKEILINDEPFDQNKSYNVLTVNYLINGGDDMSFFKEAFSTFSLETKLREAFISQIELLNQQGKQIYSQTDNRITIE